MTGRSIDIYGGRDPRFMPAYSLPEAAHYLALPSATLRSWVLGRDYPVGAAKRTSAPLIALPDKEQAYLSFVNLVEAHVLRAIRKTHRLSMQKVRTALRVLGKIAPSEHPLAHESFSTNGADLFVEKYGHLINLSRGGQLALREALEAYLTRIVRDQKGLAIQLFPFVHSDSANEPRLVSVDPRVSFGRPVVAGTGIATAVVAGRFNAGDSLDDIASDYDVAPNLIEAAVVYESREAA